MVINLAKLFVSVTLFFISGVAEADSLSLSVKADVCEDLTTAKSRSEARLNAFDRAALLAVKNASYVRSRAQDLDDHSFTVLSYQIADKAMTNVAIMTATENKEKICIELKALLDKEEVDKILSQNIPSFNPEAVKQIAQEVNASLPKSMYETDETMPLLFIKDLVFYNNKTSSFYNKKIAGQLAFEPRVLVTETEELADYFITPKLLVSKMETIDETNSRYSMSVAVEISRPNGEIVATEQQNRYIVIKNTENTQEVAKKLMVKLIEDALKALSGKLNSLLKY